MASSGTRSHADEEASTGGAGVESGYKGAKSGMARENDDEVIEYEG